MALVNFRRCDIITVKHGILILKTPYEYMLYSGMLYELPTRLLMSHEIDQVFCKLFISISA